MCRTSCCREERVGRRRMGTVRGHGGGGVHLDGGVTSQPFQACSQMTLKVEQNQVWCTESLRLTELSTEVTNQPWQPEPVGGWLQ